MKARMIELKILPAVPNEDAECDYRQLLLNELNRVDAQTGLTFSAIEKRLELRKSLKYAGDTWLISNEHWNEVKDLLASERWAIISENLVQFIRDVNQAQEMEIDSIEDLKVKG